MMHGMMRDGGMGGMMWGTRLQLADDALLLLGQELGAGLDTEIFGDGRRRAPVVARHHEGVTAKLAG
jgi:hypothetical protein